MKSECPPPPLKVDEYTSILQTQGRKQKSEPELNSISAHSPTDSDIDMEDDITHPDEVEKSCLSNNTNGECASISQEAFVEAHRQDLQHTGGNKLSKVSIHGNLSFAEASVSKDQRGGSAVASDCEFSVTRKVSFEADDSGMIETGQNEQPIDLSVKESAQHINLSQDTVPVNDASTGQLLEGANSFKLLQGFASNSSSEKDAENLLRDVIPPSIYYESTNAEKGFTFESKVGVGFESLSESNKHMLSKPATESPRNVMEADKSYFATRIVEKFSDKRHRGKDSVSDGTSVAFQSKGLPRNCDSNSDLDGANLHKPDMKSNFSKLNLDEFGRLVRECVSDSDTSNSPHYTRKPAGRDTKKNSRQSRSRSPHDRRRRRRRSPLRRKERRRRSRSSSPIRRRSRSRSPELRRDSEFSGDKRRLKKGQLPECFDFLRGKCYHGATCWYSHHESDKSEKLRHNRGKQHNLSIPDFHEESKVFSDNELRNKWPKLPQGFLKEAEDAKELPVDSMAYSLDKLNSLKPGSLLAKPSVKQNSVILEFPSQYSDKTPQIIDQQGKRMDDSVITESSSLLQASTATSTHLLADRPDPKQGPSTQLFFTGSPMMEPCSTEQVPSQSLKEFSPSVANHPSELTLPLPSVSQVISAPFAQPITQDYNMMLPFSRFQSTSEKFSLHQPPAFYQHSRFSVPSNSSPSSFLPPPPPPPPRSFLGDEVTTREHSILSQHIQQPLQSLRDGSSPYASIRGQAAEMPNRSQNGQYQAYPLTWEPDQMVHITDNFGASSLHVSNLTTRHSGRHMMGEQNLTGYPVQGMSPSQSFAQAKPYSLLSQSPDKRVHSSLAGGLPSDSNSSHPCPYFQQTSHVLQYSAAAGVPAQLAHPANVSRSCMSVATPDFLERNRSSYVHDFEGSKISNHFNPYAYSTFDLPLNSKFSSNAFIQEKDAAINSEYDAPVELSSVPEHKIASVGSETIVSSSRSGLPAESVLPRPGGDQYDPLFDSIEPTSNSSTRAEHKKYENTGGDSDTMLRFCASGSVLNIEGIHPEGRTALSVSDSLQNEEYGETADAEVGAVLNGSPNDATDMSAGEIEIDQVKISGKKKVKDSRSMKLLKISIATFVKEVLKPSWRQGNMSKEAFKTIVKKTVDKVSGAMISHRIPKSQAKMNHYIDSSRGKLTKLVMGYVDKYAKV